MSAETALAAILGGDEAGFADYRRSLHGDSLAAVPAGLHVRLLEQAGRAADAERLRALAVEMGCDLALRAGSFLGADAGAAAAEYEELLAAGTINSRMIHEYLKVLAGLGRWDAVAQLLGRDRLLQTVPLGPALASEVDALLLSLEDDAEAQDAVQSVRNMRMVRHFEALDHPAAVALIRAIEREAGAYLSSWQASDHPVGHLVPQAFDIRAWGLISRGQGYNIPHIHAYGWATGVYYPRFVDGSGGELVIGRPRDSAGDAEQWHERRIRPEAGLLVLMPSFATHWTEPLEGPGLRTSVAFDVVPAALA